MQSVCQPEERSNSFKQPVIISPKNLWPLIIYSNLRFVIWGFDPNRCAYFFLPSGFVFDIARPLPSVPLCCGVVRRRNVFPEPDQQISRWVEQYWGVPLPEGDITTPPGRWCPPPTHFPLRSSLCPASLRHVEGCQQRAWLVEEFGTLITQGCFSGTQLNNNDFFSLQFNSKALYLSLEGQFKMFQVQIRRNLSHTKHKNEDQTNKHFSRFVFLYFSRFFSPQQTLGNF